MEGFLLLGFLVGMSHALEADHLAAVGAMAVGDGGGRTRLAIRGAAWGLGHTVTLFAISAGVILFGLTFTDRAAAALEFAVGVLLVVLGIDVLRRLRRQRIHFHAHDHGDGRRHLHAHSHLGEAVPHRQSRHDHAHRHSFPLRALLVGLVHGAAGSAGLLALTVAATRDPLTALGYVLVFGLGSMIGMAALSLVAAWPLGAAERSAKLLHQGLTLAVALLAIGLGMELMAKTGPLAWTLF